MELGQYLEQLHKGQGGGSQVAWARKSGVSYTSLWRWLRGKSLPRDAELESALRALGADARQRTEAFALLERARGKGVIRLADQTGLPLLDRSHLLVALRERVGLTQRAAAERAGIPRATLSRWEQGETWPSAERLHTLCFHYGVSQDELMALTLSPRSGERTRDIALDLDDIRRQLDAANISYGNSIYEIQPIPALILAQRLSQYAATNVEARALLSRVYSLLTALSTHSLTLPQAAHYLQRARQVPPTTAEAATQLLLAQTTLEESRAFVPGLSKARQRQLTRSACQYSHVLLSRYSPPLTELSPPLQMRWTHERSYHAAVVGDTTTALALTEQADTVAEQLGPEAAFMRLWDKYHTLSALGDYSGILQMLPTTPTGDGHKDGISLQRRAHAYEKLGALSEAKSSLRQACAVAVHYKATYVENLARLESGK